MAKAAVAEISRLVAETTEWRAFHRRRQQSAPTKAARQAAGIEALACAIREIALRQALWAVQQDFGE